MRNLCRFNYFERRLSWLFANYASLVAAYPWMFVLIPVVIAGGLAVGNFFKVNVKDAFYLYTPSNGRAVYEKLVIEQKWPPKDGTYAPARSVSPKGECNIIAYSHDNGNVLRFQVARALIELNQFVTNDIAVTVSGKRYTYQDLCLKFLRYCPSNPQIYFVNQVYQNPDAYGPLTYPSVRFKDQTYYIANSLSGVILDPDNGHVAEAKAWQLIYQLKYETPQLEHLSQLWQKEFQKQLLAYRNPFLKLDVFHSLTLETELSRNADRLVPRFALCFVVLIVFAILSTLSFVWSPGSRIPYVDWICSKPTMAIVGVIGAAMGVFASIGLLAFCGYEHSDLILVMPFLVVAVRLDNTFLMISALHSIDRSLSVVERIRLASEEAAVSITITVLTDVLSFGCGYFTAFPAVRMFCIYTTVAITVTFLFQLTFVLAFLVLAARLEDGNKHNLFPCLKTVPSSKIATSSLFEKLFCLGTYHERKQSPPKQPKHLNKMIRNHYAPFLMNFYTKLAIFAIFLVYLATSIYGCCLLRQGLEPIKLLVDDSYAIGYYRKLEDYFWKHGVQAQIVFNNAGDLANPNIRREVYDVLKKFASGDHAVGFEGGVEFWLRDFEDFVKSGKNPPSAERGDKEVPFFEYVKYFLSLDENARYRTDMTWKLHPVTGVEIIDSFRALVGMKNFAHALDQIETVDQFRAIASMYPKFNITTYHVMWLFVDQYEQILPNTLQEIYSGVSCMVAVALLLIPSPICSMWVALSVVSIDVGVIGYMTLWGMNMDAVSMISIIMSIGFSVDFSAHIAYSFAAADSKDPVEKAREALAATAWPILQGGVATVMGVIVLADINSYMVAAFFKTVFLVVVLGLTHGLVFLPVVLSLFTCNLHNTSKLDITPTEAPEKVKHLNDPKSAPIGSINTLQTDQLINLPVQSLNKNQKTNISLISVIKLPYESHRTLSIFKPKFRANNLLRSTGAIVVESDIEKSSEMQIETKLKELKVADTDASSRSSSVIPEDP